jgi:hypothetical protein
MVTSVKQLLMVHGRRRQKSMSMTANAYQGRNFHAGQELFQLAGSEYELLASFSSSAYQHRVS